MSSETKESGMILSLDADVEVGDSVTLDQFIAMDALLKSVRLGLTDDEGRTRKKRALAMLGEIKATGQARLPISLYRTPAMKSDSRLNAMRSAWNDIARTHLKHRHAEAKASSLWPNCQLCSSDEFLIFCWADGKSNRVRSKKAKIETSNLVESDNTQQPDESLDQRSIKYCSHPHNLPNEFTRFVGRKDELGTIGKLVHTERLTTLIGVGGAGKTRLAHQIGHEVLPLFRDGVWQVEFVYLSDSRLVPRTLADSLGISVDAPDASLLQVVINRLRSKSMLLIFNNCEHVLNACKETAEKVLKGCPNVNVLATSRMKLGIEGECDPIIPPLKFPTDEVSYSTAELIDNFSAIEFFVDRAGTRLKPFLLTEQYAPAVIEICRKLEGIPMFLLFAAKRIREYDEETPDKVLESLNDVFRALCDGSATDPSKDQTARALIDWSYDPLSDAEKRLFRHLSIFRGGWTLASAHAICGCDIDDFDFRKLHNSLLRKSLIEPLNTSQPDGAKRYRLLEPLRAYAEEKLDDAGESSESRQRHLRWLTSRARMLDMKSHGPDRHKQREQMERDLDNVRWAIEWSKRGGDAIDDALDLASSLKWFWIASNRTHEGTKRLYELLHHPASRQTIARARGWITAASLRPFADHFGSALAPVNRHWVTESLSIAEASGNLEVQSEALDCLAGMEQAELHWPEAKTLRQRAIKNWKSIGSTRGMCTSMLGLIRCLGAMSDFASLREIGHECLRLARMERDDEMESVALTQLALEAKDSQRYPQMREYLKELLDVERRRGFHNTYFYAFSELTRTCFDDETGAIRDEICGEYLPKAQSFFEESLATASKERDTLGKASALFHLGQCARYRQESHQALQYFDQAAAVGRTCPGDASFYLPLQVAFEYLRFDDRQRADRMIRECLDATRAIDERDGIRWSTTMNGLLDSRNGHHQLAIERLEEALRMAREEGHLGAIVFTLYLLANEKIRANLPKDAEPCAVEMSSLSATHDDRGWIGTSHVLSGTLKLIGGDSNAAREQFRQGLKIFADNGRLHDVRVAIQAIGQCDAHDRNMKRAAKLFGAADRPLFTDWIWACNPVYKQFNCIALEALGNEAYARAYEAGLGLSLKQSIDYARR